MRIFAKNCEDKTIKIHSLGMWCINAWGKIKINIKNGSNVTEHYVYIQEDGRIYNTEIDDGTSLLEDIQLPVGVGLYETINTNKAIVVCTETGQDERIYGIMSFNNINEEIVIEISDNGSIECNKTGSLIAEISEEDIFEARIHVGGYNSPINL